MNSTPAPWHNRSGRPCPYRYELRLPPIQHPLAALFQRAAQSLTTSLNHDAIRLYNGTIRNFLNFLGAQYPQVQSLDQLRRDPHILAWFTRLRSHQPPLATITYTIHLYHLRRMLEELAWTEDLPLLARLVLRQDTPRPRPLFAAPTDGRSGPINPAGTVAAR